MIIIIHTFLQKMILSKMFLSLFIVLSTLFLYAYKVKNQNSIPKYIVKIGYTYPISAMHTA